MQRRVEAYCSWALACVAQRPAHAFVLMAAIATGTGAMRIGKDAAVICCSCNTCRRGKCKMGCFKTRPAVHERAGLVYLISPKRLPVPVSALQRHKAQRQSRPCNKINRSSALYGGFNLRKLPQAQVKLLSCLSPWGNARRPRCASRHFRRTIAARENSKRQDVDSNSRWTLPVKLKRWNAAQAARVAP